MDGPWFFANQEQSLSDVKSRAVSGRTNRSLARRQKSSDVKWCRAADEG